MTVAPVADSRWVAERRESRDSLRGLVEVVPEASTKAPVEAETARVAVGKATTEAAGSEAVETEAAVLADIETPQ